MVIISVQSRGQEVKFGNTLVKFDINGASEVEDAVGQEIIAKYPWIKSKEQFLEEKTKAQEPKVIFDVQKVQELEIKLLDEKKRGDKLQAELVNAQSVIEQWKAKYTSIEEKLKAFNVLTADNKESAPEQPENIQKDDSNTEVDLRVELEKKTKDELKEIATKMEIDFDGRSSEKTLIGLILEKANA